MFKNRSEAGLKLAEELMKYKDDDVIILGIPRGGAIIAKYAADGLHKCWDIIVSRKIGAPFNNEIAIGAVAQDGFYLIDEKTVKYFMIEQKYIDSEIEKELKEIERRLIKYRGTVDFPDVTNKSVIVVDDGIATGYTMAVALNSVRKHNPKKVIVAVPVASPDAIDIVDKYADEIISLEIPKMFISVGQNFLQFDQSSDEDVTELFKQSYSKKMV